MYEDESHRLNRLTDLVITRLARSGVVWWATVDAGTWACQVTRESEDRGCLTVSRITDGEVILTEDVALSDQAFGPDVDDIALWIQIVTEAIDHDQAQKRVRT